MPRKLAKDYLAALIIADMHGEIRPCTKQMVDACIRLAADDYIREYDGAPGVYWITAAGEQRLQEALARKVA